MIRGWKTLQQKELKMLLVYEDGVFKPQISFFLDGLDLKIEIETERLCICSYKEDDFENFVKLYSDEKLTKYFDHGKPRSRLEVKKLTDENGSKFFKNGEPFGLFSIFQKKDMAFIGQIDLIPFNEPGVVEIGCIFDRKYHNQGFCPEAVRAFVFAYVNELNNKGFKFNGVPINRVIATVHPANLPSKRVLQNIGMTFEKSEERFGHPRLWFSFIPKSLISTAHTWKAEEYNLHSSVQRDSALQILQMISWKGNEQVLDIGCGDGKITAMIANYVSNGQVAGIDISQEMISFAQQCFSKIKHPNLSFSIQDAQHLNYDQKFDVIFSSFALQWVRDISSFFKGAYKSLSPSGVLAITVPLGISVALEESINALISSQEWSSYFHTPLHPGLQFISDCEYKKLLYQHQFMPIQFTTVQQIVTFPSRDSFEKYVIQWFVYLNLLPAHLKQVFFKQIIDKYLENEPILDSGEVVFKFSRVDILASKTTP